MAFGRKIPRETLQRYAGKLLVETARNNPKALELGASRKDVTLVYLDIWGFTEVTNYASPEAVIDLLVHYFSRMTKLIRANQGFVDKFFGDAIFNIFGAPVDDQKHALHACQTALDCYTETLKMAAEWSIKGFGRVQQSIGVVTGPAIVGNIGNEERAMFTAVGEAVSLTVQLQQASRLYRAPVIISRDTHTKVKQEYFTRELDVIRIAGSERTTRIYELVGKIDTVPNQTKIVMDLFKRGLKLFREREWDRAERRFKDADRMAGDDGPSRLYLRRCTLYKKHPPPPEWDLVHSHAVHHQ